MIASKEHLQALLKCAGRGPESSLRTDTKRSNRIVVGSDSSSHGQKNSVRASQKGGLELERI
jgi:hypothetical protein